MRPERWRHVQFLFSATADLDPASRDRLLAAACADDRQLRGHVEALLRADVADGTDRSIRVAIARAAADLIDQRAQTEERAPPPSPDTDPA